MHTLNIDDKGIKQEKNKGKDRSVNWDRLKSLSLGRHHIHFQYRHSSVQDNMELPEHRYKQFQQMKAKLDEAAEPFNLKYELEQLGQLCREMSVKLARPLILFAFTQPFQKVPNR